MSNTCCKQETLAMATVPMQEWDAPYDWKTALQAGTIFPCLNLEFFKADQLSCPSCSSEMSEQEAALNELSAVSFAVNDLTLFLDTHPESQEALNLFKKLTTQRLTLLNEYAAKYQPLTLDSMITGTPDTTEYGWAKGPLPWEGGHI